MSDKKTNLYPAVILGLLSALVFVSGLLVMNKAEHSELGNGHSEKTLNSGAEDQVTYEWSLVTTWPKNFPGLGSAAENFAHYVKEMSAGRLQVKVHGANELVPALGVFDAVSSGSVQAGHGAAYYWKGKIPASPFFTSVPFGLNAQEMNGWLHYGGGLELWREIYEPFNLRPYAGGNTGVQMAGWFNREINSIEDLKGLKMRIPGLGGEVFTRAGGTAVNIPGGELYTAMQTGVIDATEWVGPYNDLAFGFQQVAKYYYYPGWHEPGPTLEFIINIDAYKALPKDLQSIVEIAVKAANQDMLDEYTGRNNSALIELVNTHGVQVRKLPDDVLATLKKYSEEIYQETAANDATFAKVYAAYKAFGEQAVDYHKISEQAYYDTRE